MIACRTIVPETCAVFAIGGYTGSTRWIIFAAATLPPMRTGAVFTGFGGGGGGGSPLAMVVTRTPAPEPPNTPPSLTYIVGASSFTTAMFLGMTVGATTRLMGIIFGGAFTTLGAGGGGGGGGGGATRNVFSIPLGSACV